MNADAARADRNAAVRKAARAWKEAGAIGEDSLKAVEAAYPDDRSRVGPVFRVLLFLFTLLSAAGGFGFVMALFNGVIRNTEVFGPLLLVFGGTSAIATDMLITFLRRRQGGIEAALSLVAVGCLTGFAAWVLFDPLKLDEQAALTGLYVFAALLLAAAAWRWGYPIYAGASAAALLGAVAAVPGGRLAWIALPLAVAPWLGRLADSERLPPAHRDSWRAVLLVGLVGAYVAVNLVSFATRFVEKVGGRWDGPLTAVSDPVRWLVLAATALLPIAYLAVGVRTRRYPFLLAGLGTGVASVITLVDYADLKPVWAVATLAGALLVAGVFALRRYLETGPGGERHGFTAAPLFGGAERRQWLEAGAAAVTLAPEARTLREEPKFSGGGGEFGGGGSSSEF